MLLSRSLSLAGFLAVTAAALTAQTMVLRDDSEGGGFDQAAGLAEDVNGDGLPDGTLLHAFVGTLGSGLGAAVSGAGPVAGALIRMLVVEMVEPAGDHRLDGDTDVVARLFGLPAVGKPAG